MKEKLANWLPPIFCAILSVITVDASASSPSGTAGITAFVCFIPMCFFFAALNTTRLEREIRTLRDQIAKLQPESTP